MTAARLERITTPVLILALIFALGFLFFANNKAGSERHGFTLAFDGNSDTTLLSNHSSAESFTVRYSCDGAELAALSHDIPPGAVARLPFPSGALACGQRCLAISVSATPTDDPGALLSIYRNAQ